MSSAYKPTAALSVDEQAQMYKALGSAVRLHILRILDERPGKVHVGGTGSAPAPNGLVERLRALYEFGGIAQPTVSHHLHKLLLLKLIEVDHRDGNLTYYRVRHETLRTLREAMV